MKRERKDQVPRGALNALILALLAETPMHGYRLARALEERSEGAFRLREGTLYPALHELELAGFVDARWDTGPRTPERGKPGRKRRVYRLTATGRREAKGTRREWLAVAELLRRLLSGPTEAKS